MKKKVGQSKIIIASARRSQSPAKPPKAVSEGELAQSKGCAGGGDLTWNMSLFYASPDDPAIEMDLSAIERQIDSFARKYDTKNKTYLRGVDELFAALQSFEALMAEADPKPLMYFYSLKDVNTSDSTIAAKYSLLTDRFVNATNKTTFFPIALGGMDKDMQKTALQSKKLTHFKVFLERTFDDARHFLTTNEENILNSKLLPAQEMWVMANERVLNSKSVKWKGKTIPLSRALSEVQQLKSANDRKALSKKINRELAFVGDIAEAEVTAVVMNKKIDDELRHYGTPFEETVQKYRNDPAVVEKLCEVVVKNFDVSHRFYALKCKLLKEKKLSYADRSAKIGFIKKKFTFAESVKSLKEIFGEIDRKYPEFIDKYLKGGQIDAFPRFGKISGAYCNHGFKTPILLLLNHTDDLNSMKTMAHELGHAFHSELSLSQGPIYARYSTSLAETASTLFESIAMEALMEKLSNKEKVIMLHDKINDDIATIFRQIACFNFEKDIHDAVRSRGYVSKRELAQMHNIRMKEYLGPSFEMNEEDGYMFTHWSHIRRFFYVYTYAYGMLVSKALLRRYRTDPKFWKQIEKFLSAGGKESPERILKEIGIDVSRADFWLEGIREIEDNITKLEALSS
jgi:oligoendopeptidase F